MSAIADRPVGVTGARPKREADVRRCRLFGSTHELSHRPGFSPSLFLPRPQGWLSRAAMPWYSMADNTAVAGTVTIQAATMRMTTERLTISFL